MKKLTLTLLATLIVAALLLPAMPSRAEKAPESPARLLAKSTHVVTGKVQAIYSREVKTDEWIYTRFVAEILVDTVEKTEKTSAEPKKGSVTYARYWKRKYRGLIPPPAAYGHYGIPKEGDHVKAFLVRGSNDGYGHVTTDGGFDVIGPNGFAISKKPAARK